MKKTVRNTQATLRNTPPTHEKKVGNTQPTHEKG